jgi:uncharacterized lipoprotein YmbA
MTRNAPRALAALALVAALALACAKTPKPEFFTLRSASGDAASAPVASRPDLGVVVGPLTFPRYLDRPEIVSRDGANRLEVPDAHRWGGSLRDDILRVVADDLARLLGTARVAVYPDEPRFAGGYRVLLDVAEFERVAADKVSLRARVTIASLPDGKAIVVEDEAVEQPIASASYEDLVAAESAALGSVSKRIADRIAALPARR